MLRLKFIVPSLFLFVSLHTFSQEEPVKAITSEWKTISMGKLQKKPVFKEPMIVVRFISEDNVRFLHLSLKYMFTDAVFEEAVPVEYYKNEKIEFNTDRSKYELKAVRYSKARRMSSVAQKTADIKVVFSGDLSFIGTDLIREMTVHYAQGYQHIKLSPEEASLLRDTYKEFLATLPKLKERPKPEIMIEGETTKAKADTVQSNSDSLDKLRQRARTWRN